MRKQSFCGICAKLLYNRSLRGFGVVICVVRVQNGLESDNCILCEGRHTTRNLRRQIAMRIGDDLNLFGYTCTQVLVLFLPDQP